jgi:hypothetical protein
MKSRSLLLFIVFSLCFFILSCWDITADVKISRNGSAHLKVLHRTIWCNFAPDLADDMRKDFKKVKFWYGRQYCYVSGEMWGNVRDLKFGKLLNVKVVSNKKSGFFTNRYRFLSYVGSYDKEFARDSGLNHSISKLINIHYHISMPGKIVNTTGSLSKDKRTASFHYSLYSLGMGKKKMLVESEYGRYSNWLSAHNKANLIIEEKEQELFDIEASLNEVSYKIDMEKRFQKSKESYMKESNEQILKLMNNFVTFYHKKNKSFPGSDEQLYNYLKDNNVDVDELPQPIHSVLVYNNEKHRFYLEAVSAKEQNE